MALRAASARGFAHAIRASVISGLRRAEAPFRQSLADAQSDGMSLTVQNIRDGRPGKARL